MTKYLAFATIALFAVSLFFAPSASAVCSCMCVDAEAMGVCTGFGDSQSTTLECGTTLSCPPLTDADAVDTAASLTHTDNPDVPEGSVCEARNVWRADLGRYNQHTVCRPAT